MAVDYKLLSDLNGPRGLRGLPGEPGIAGGNALANDAATATYVESSVSDTRSALDGRYATRQDANPLLRFHGRIGNRQSLACNIMFMGDSIATEYGANAAGRGFGPQAVQRLRSMFPIDNATGYGLSSTTVIGGYGFIPARPSGAILSWFTSNGYLAYDGNYEAVDAGWALSAVRLPGAAGGAGTAAVTLKFLGTGCDVQFAPGTTQTSVMISVNGGAEVQHVMTPGAASSYRVSGLTRGLQEVKVRGQYGNPVCYGFMTHSGDSDWGIRFVNAGKSGSRAVDFAPTLGGNSSWLTHWDALPPSLIVLSWGTNDVSNSAASFEAALTDVADAIRAKSSTVPIVFMMMFRRSDRTEAQWAEYTDAMKRVQALTTVSVFIDAGERFPDAATANGLGLMSDSLHPNSAGHGLLGHYLAEMIAPRI